jgi:hypothetical protein
MQMEGSARTGKKGELVEFEFGLRTSSRRFPFPTTVRQRVEGDELLLTIDSGCSTRNHPAASLPRRASKRRTTCSWCRRSRQSASLASLFSEVAELCLYTFHEQFTELVGGRQSIQGARLRILRESPPYQGQGKLFGQVRTAMLAVGMSRLPEVQIRKRHTNRREIRWLALNNCLDELGRHRSRTRSSAGIPLLSGAVPRRGIEQKDLARLRSHGLCLRQRSGLASAPVKKAAAGNDGVLVRVKLSYFSRGGGGHRRRAVGAHG